MSENGNEQKGPDGAPTKGPWPGAGSAEAAAQSGLPLFMPTPGWAVRQPPQQDPKKKDGNMLPMAWMSAIGVYAVATVDGSITSYGVLVVHGRQQVMIAHVDGLEWVPAQYQPAQAQEAQGPPPVPQEV